MVRLCKARNKKLQRALLPPRVLIQLVQSNIMHMVLEYLVDIFISFNASRLNLNFEIEFSFVK